MGANEGIGVKVGLEVGLVVGFDVGLVVGDSVSSQDPNDVLSDFPKSPPVATFSPSKVTL